VTVATCERSFSKLKLIENFLRRNDVNKDWTCKDKDKDQAYKDQEKDKD